MVEIVSPIAISASVTDYFVIISDGVRILLRETADGGLDLPHWSDSRYYSWDRVDHVNGHVLENWGIKATTLSCLSNRENTGSRVYELELHGVVKSAAPDGFVWYDLQGIKNLNLSDPGNTTVMHNWFTLGSFSRTDDAGCPWRRSGWIGNAVSWILDELKRHVIQPLGPIEQIRTSRRSTTLFVRTTGGDVYFKAFRTNADINERFVGWELGPYFSEYITSHLAYSEQRNWALVRVPGSGGSGYAETPDEELVHSALSMAHFQLSCQTYVQGFLELGFRDYRLNMISPLLIPLVKELEKNSIGFVGSELRELRRLLPVIVENCISLAKYNIPAMVDFGEIHIAGLPIQSGAIYPDWSEPCITHPFFRYLLTEPVFGGSDYQAGHRARMAYLNTFTIYETPDRLLEAWYLARVVAPLYYAVRYYRYLLSGDAENVWDARENVRFYIRMLMERVKEFNGSR